MCIKTVIQSRYSGQGTLYKRYLPTKNIDMVILSMLYTKRDTKREIAMQDEQEQEKTVQPLVRH